MKRYPAAATLTVHLLATTIAFALGCAGGLDEDVGDVGDVGAAEEALTTCVSISDTGANEVPDTYVWAAYPGYNPGNVSEDSIGLSQGGAQQALIKADLGVIPAGAVVTSATVTLLMSSSAAATVSVHKVTAPWSEGTVTWSSFNGAYDPAVLASQTVSGWGVARTFDITSLAAEWVSGATPNHGVLFERDLSATTTFKSSEDATAARRPVFQVCYSTDGAAGSSSSSASSSTSSSTSSGAGGGTGGAGGTGGTGGGGTGGAGGAGGGDTSAPPVLTNLKLWMRADDVTLSGAFVTGIHDKSGNGHTVTQSASSRWATYVPGATELNGKPGISFTGTQWYEKVGGIQLPFAQTPVSVYTVGTRYAVPDGGPSPFFGYGQANGAAHIYARSQGLTGYVRGYFGNAYTSTLSVGPTSSAHVVSYTFSQNDLHIYLDGAGEQVFAAQMWDTPTAPMLRVGTSDMTTPSSIFNGLIAEILIYEGAHGAADRQAVEGYLKARYGVP